MQVLLVKKYVVDNKQIIDFFAIPHFKTSGVVPDLIRDSNMIQTWFKYDSKWFKRYKKLNLNLTQKWLARDLKSDSNVIG